LSYDGAEPERKEAMESKPEGVDADGEEWSARSAASPEDRRYLNFDKVETLGSSPRSPSWCCYGQAHRVQIASADVVTRSGFRSSCSNAT